MNILGINSVYHESAAAVLIDGALVAAAEEERFNRIKHGKQSNVDNPHQFPEQAIRFCLNYAGLRARDIDHVAYSFNPRLRRAQFRAEWWLDPRLEEIFLLRLGEVHGVAEQILGRSLRGRFHFVPHHLAHAASAYFPSKFEHAAILTIDGLGEAACSTLAVATGSRIRILETFNYPHSLGFVWEIISTHLGFTHYDASKVMGLAAYGNPEIFRPQLRSIIRVGEDHYAVDPEAAGFQGSKSGGLQTLLGPPRFPDAKIQQSHADIAAALQAATNAAVMALVRRLKRKVPLDNLCIAGAEKPSRARQLHAISRAFVQPARNYCRGQVGRSHASTQQDSRARCGGYDRRRQDRRLVSGSHGIRAASSWQSFAACRPAPTGDA
ncbi:MAG: carbamoyltransferase N-terminal domain-containing protein [Xanthobacteraceae bacterium]